MTPSKLLLSCRLRAAAAARDACGDGSDRAAAASAGCMGHHADGRWQPLRIEGPHQRRCRAVCHLGRRAVLVARLAVGAAVPFVLHP